MKPAVIILARGGSKGIPHKNIQLVGPRTLLAWGILAGAEVVGEEHVYVSTDDKDIMDEITRCGANVIVRPPELSTDTTLAIQAVQHAETQMDESYDTIVLIQCTTFPLHVRNIRRTLDEFESKQADSAFTARRVAEFLWHEAEDGYAFPINQYSRDNRQNASPEYTITGECYAVRRDMFRRSGQYLTGRVVLVKTTEKQIDIDEQADLELARMMYERQQVTV